jgi:hypothetical protein
VFSKNTVHWLRTSDQTMSDRFHALKMLGQLCSSALTGKMELATVLHYMRIESSDGRFTAGIKLHIAADCILEIHTLDRSAS